MKAKTKRGRSKAKPGTANLWDALAWDDLTGWAGARSVHRGRTYQRQGRVEGLVRDGEARLLATVTGQRRYVVAVTLASKGRGKCLLQSTCTCPVGFDGCKHAVATVAAYLDALAQGVVVPDAEDDDPRREAPVGGGGETDEQSDDWDQDFESPDPVPPRRAGRQTMEQWDDRIRAHLHGKSKEELFDYIWSLMQRLPELRGELKERITLGEADVDRILAETRREIRRVTAEPGWRNHWNDEGYTPDYAPVERRLRRLAEMGHHEQVATLGRELLMRFNDQIEQSHDEGETATAAAGCLALVFEAVKQSDLPAPEKILYAIDAQLADDFGVLDDAPSSLLNAQWTPADWSIVADRLARRLKSTAASGGAGSTGKYQRDRVSNWLLQALKLAGREAERLAVYETEARQTGSYRRLVEFLLDQDRLDDAHRWACEGVAKTRDTAPGVSDALTQSLCEIARRRKQWDVVAAHAAAMFFTQPDAGSFTDLIKAARKARRQQPVEAAARAFLETGIAPIRPADGAKAASGWIADPDWPLPMPDYLTPPRWMATRLEPPGPRYDVLIDLAIEQKRPDDVLRWYDKVVSGDVSKARGTSNHDRVAQAVAATHPQRALDIYQRGLDAHLPHASLGAYETCTKYLGKMKPLFHALGQDEQWATLLTDVRHRYRNRPRFMELLDWLDGRTIVQQRRGVRR